MQKWLVLFFLIIIAILAILYGKGMLSGGGGPVVKVTNESSYDVSHGVLVLHDDAFSMNYLGVIAPSEYQKLAEVGDPSDLKQALAGEDGVYRVIEVGALGPGTEEMVSLGSLTGDPFPENLSDIRASYMGMIVQTNDGVVWVNSVSLDKLVYESGVGDSEEVQMQWAEIIDMGSEENSPIGSGFDGGQPDPSRGAENIDNGVPTEETVSHHTQFYDDPDVTIFVLGFVRSDS